MKQLQTHWLRGYWLIPVWGFLGMLHVSAARAQVISDTTLDGESSRVVQDAMVRGQLADLIEGGATRGSNLFHSFAEFNVGESQRVYFANPTGIETIFSRITGSSGSDIMGTLGVDGGANLFLLNPNGIVFGPNAQLDISGSFLASTADSFAFADGSEFSATSPQAPELLSVNVPLGVQWGPGVASGITNEGNLSVGQDLTLSGGNVSSTGILSALSGNLLVESVDGDTRVQEAFAQTATFSASNSLILRESQLYTIGDLNLLAVDTVQVRDSAANPFIAYAGGSLDIQGNQNIDIFALSHPSSGFVAGENMVMRSANSVSGDAHYWTGGSFRIEQLDGDLGNLFSPYDPVIRAAGDVAFDSYTGASLHIFAGGSVTVSGVINITRAAPSNELPPEERQVTLSNPTQTLTNEQQKLTIEGNLGEDNLRPTLDVRAGTTEFGTLAPLPAISEIIPSPPNATDVATGSTIRIGGVITAANVDSLVFLTNQYSPNTLLPSGDIEIGNILNQSINASGGSVIIDSRGSIEVMNGIATSSGSGNGGQILFLSGGDIRTEGEFTTGTTQGNAGEIIFNAGGNIITAGAIKSDVSGADNAGDANSIVFISNGSIYTGSIVTSTNNNVLGGDGGDIFFDARGSITTVAGTTGNVPGSFGVASFAQNGNSGNITLISRESTINTTQGDVSSFAPNGQAGSVFFRAPLDISIANVSATSQSESLREITAVSITSTQGAILINDAEVSVDNSGEGFAGDIIFSAEEDIRISNSAISSNGNFGVILIKANSLFLDGAEISTVSSGAGDRSGLIEIAIHGEILFLDNESRITARAVNRPDGGEIRISIPNGFLMTRPGSNSDIIASAEEGDGGVIEVEAFAIFGIEPRDLDSPFSDFLANSQSGTDGEILLLTLGIDPSRGLAELPIDVIDVAGLVATGCIGDNRAGVEDQGEFSVTGRGGLSPGPTEVLAAPGSPASLATLDDETLSDRPTAAPSVATAPVERFEEAQGLAKDADGRVTLATQGRGNSGSPMTVAALNCDAL